MSQVRSSRDEMVSRPREGAQATTIVGVKIDSLFGLYSYRIPAKGKQLDRIPILYGENGLGKTNILRILFHLLSPAPDRGHRTSLGEIKFKSVEVSFANGTVLSAKRTAPALTGAMHLEVRRRSDTGEVTLGKWDWTPRSASASDETDRWLEAVDPELLRRFTAETPAKQRESAQYFITKFLTEKTDPLAGERPYLEALRANVPLVYFLTSDRSLSSDQVESDRPRVWSDPSRPLRAEELVAIGRGRALASSISLASRSLSQLGVRATRRATVSMHTIYRDLIKRLATRTARKQRETTTVVEELTIRLQQLSTAYTRYAKYGLTSELDGDALVDLLKEVDVSDLSVAAGVLRPYVESLTELSKSLEGAYSVIDKFVTTVNGFLYDKTLEFNVVDGIAVKNRLREVLKPDALSSGEQQLLLLFCHIILARESGGVFIIDEPELSLNVKWQRRLVGALASLDTEQNLQFIIASHSLEILTKHRSSVVPLEEALSE